MAIRMEIRTLVDVPLYCQSDSSYLNIIEINLDAVGAVGLHHLDDLVHVGVVWFWVAIHQFVRIIPNSDS
jgi:hypothetical protein